MISVGFLLKKLAHEHNLVVVVSCGLEITIISWQLRIPSFLDPL